VDRTQKEQAVQELNADLATKAQIVLVLEQTGLTVAESTELRRSMSGAGARFKVVKNTLASLAIVGTPFENLKDLLKGPTILAYSADPVAPAKVANDFAKKNDKLKVMGGSFNGKLLAEQDVSYLAKLPSLDQLRSTLIAMIQTPGTRIAGVLQAPAGQLARVCGAYGSKS
jgi:large subunit ribosomal protein L10